MQVKCQSKDLSSRHKSSLTQVKCLMTPMDSVIPLKEDVYPYIIIHTNVEYLP